MHTRSTLQKPKAHPNNGPCHWRPNLGSTSAERPSHSSASSEAIMEFLRMRRMSWTCPSGLRAIRSSALETNYTWLWFWKVSELETTSFGHGNIILTLQRDLETGKQAKGVGGGWLYRKLARNVLIPWLVNLARKTALFPDITNKLSPSQEGFGRWFSCSMAGICDFPWV